MSTLAEFQIYNTYQCNWFNLFTPLHLILTLTSLYIYETLCFMIKHCHNLKYRFEIHEHNTRSKNDLYQQYCNTSNYQKSVLNMGTKLFNKLPSQTKHLDNYNKFKKELKNFLLVNSFYTIAEFFSL